jgi:hypothetical protein
MNEQIPVTKKQQGKSRVDRPAFSLLETTKGQIVCRQIRSLSL